MTGLFDEVLKELDSAGNLQKFYGITKGIVKENWDKKFPGMLKVEIILGEEGKNITDWVRVMVPYAGATYGQYMLPEVGDEVIVAFHMGDTNRPIILGSLWNSEKKFAEQTATEKNTVKKISTKGGHEIIFEEEKGKERIEIHTPKNFKIMLEDEPQKITITDEKGDNMMTIDSKGGEIAIKAKSTISLDAGGKAKLTLDGKADAANLEAGNITLKAKQAFKAEGNMVNVKGSMVTIKGSSTLQAEGGSMAIIKGGMVKIN